MRILVVDDELVSRKKMEIIMSSFGECVAVDSGETALIVFEAALADKKPFDLITLDVSMPQMDGTEVLFEIRKTEQQHSLSKDKRSKVIMVTAQSDKDTVITCIQAGCDSYVVKPFDRASITGRLVELGLETADARQEEQSLRDLVMQTITKFNQGKISLPVLPEISREIETAMNKPTSGPEDLARIIEKDTVIAVKLIATANSALYKSGDKVQDLRTAIARLGIREVQNIVSVIANRNLYKSGNTHCNELLKKLWLHSLCCAYACRAAAEKLGLKDGGKSFLMGLTHDIGCMLLVKSIGDSVADTMVYDKNDLMECIHEVHVSFGAKILANMGFGPEFSEVIRLHQGSSFEKDTRKEVLIVNLADKISSAIHYGFFEEEPDLCNLESSRILGINATTLTEIAATVRQGMQEMERILTL